MGARALTGVTALGRCTQVRLAGWRVGRAKAPVAAGEPYKRLVEPLHGECGKQRFREVHLGIGHLPQHEVADTHLATGADEQVGVGQACGAEVGFQRRFVQQVGRHAGVGRQPAAGGAQHVPAAAVVDGHAQGHAAVAFGQAFDFFEQLAQRLVEGADVADDLQADAARMQVAGFLAQVTQEQLGQARNFLGRAAPVLGAEGEQGEAFHAGRHAALYQGAYAPCAAGVAHHLRQAALARPAPVAVHDDGDMARHGWITHRAVHVFLQRRGVSDAFGLHLVSSFRMLFVAAVLKDRGWADKNAVYRSACKFSQLDAMHYFRDRLALQMRSIVTGR